IDIGGGTTDISVFHRKAIKHTKVIGVAGNQVTNDIRETLGIVTTEAEKLKREHGYATEHAIIRDEDIYIKGVGARGNVKIPVSLLTQIISVRMKELFTLIDNDLRNSGLKSKVKAGIVLTGGGSLLTGCDELASEIFGLPARIGVPLDLGSGLSKEVESPEFATVAGLIRGIPGMTAQESFTRASREGKFKVNNVFKKLTDFFENL
ncbi:MAG: cell division FtsA domain-containing protein, partial [Ignavibacteria bacterium]|nr:cell division FtsA domain-containing protein [Ignavibacteria bacterium]